MITVEELLMLNPEDTSRLAIELTDFEKNTMMVKFLEKGIREVLTPMPTPLRDITKKQYINALNYIHACAEEQSFYDNRATPSELEQIRKVLAYISKYMYHLTMARLQEVLKEAR